MSNDDQSQVIREFLAEKGDSDPNGMTVGATRLSAVAFCKTLGTESSLIREIDGS